MIPQCLGVHDSFKQPSLGCYQEGSCATSHMQVPVTAITLVLASVLVKLCGELNTLLFYVAGFAFIARLVS